MMIYAHFRGLSSFLGHVLQGLGAEEEDRRTQNHQQLRGTKSEEPPGRKGPVKTCQNTRTRAVYKRFRPILAHFWQFRPLFSSFRPRNGRKGGLSPLAVTLFGNLLASRARCEMISGRSASNVDLADKVVAFKGWPHAHFGPRKRHEINRKGSKTAF